MKLMMLLFLPILMLCSADSQRKIIPFHSELNQAVRDLSRCDSWSTKIGALTQINMALSGGSKLQYTRYTVSDIIEAADVPKEVLIEQAQNYGWFGILTLLGAWKKPVVKE